MVMIRNLKVPTSFRLALTYCAVLFVSAFMPILYIVILTLNGAFLIPFRSVFTNHDVWVNSICSLVFITLHLISKNKRSVVLFSTMQIFFTVPFFTYLFGDYITDEDPYFLLLLISGTLSGFLLLIIEYIKYLYRWIILRWLKFVVLPEHTLK